MQFFNHKFRSHSIECAEVAKVTSYYILLHQQAIHQLMVCFGILAWLWHKAYHKKHGISAKIFNLDLRGGVINL